MMHDVCTKQQLYDEYVEDVCEELTATMLEILTGRPPSQNDVEQAMAHSFYAD